jgi:hypothetical protein
MALAMTSVSSVTSVFARLFEHQDKEGSFGGLGQQKPPWATAKSVHTLSMVSDYIAISDRQTLSHAHAHTHAPKHTHSHAPKHTLAHKTHAGWVWYDILIPNHNTPPCGTHTHLLCGAISCKRQCLSLHHSVYKAFQTLKQQQDRRLVLQHVHAHPWRGAVGCSNAPSVFLGVVSARSWSRR